MFAKPIAAQQEQKLNSFQELFDRVRNCVHRYRHQQDDLVIKKAEATISYAVRLP